MKTQESTTLLLVITLFALGMAAYLVYAAAEVMQRVHF